MSKFPFSKILIIIAVIVVAFLAYRFFFASSDQEVGLVSLSPAGASQTDSDQFVVLLSSLRAIDLGDLPRVLALLGGLEDFSTVLEAQTPGRSNPFLPIGRGGNFIVSTTTASTTQGQP